MVRSDLERDLPLCVSLPIELLSVEEAFPFLDLTLRDLGISQSAVKEKVFWVDSTKTRVRKGPSQLREKEVLVVEARVRVQRTGDPQEQEILYSTETHTDRSYCRSCVSVLPWRHTQRGLPENSDKTVEMVVAVDTESHPNWQKTKETKGNLILN
ncbi:uncharacterized protein [Lepisosteus oculatus]|uniref:uncharacterized protein isoform X2 n=1 Tax=Lepisosteus oculatus TaxID=7918 RepID=UPI0037153E19